MIGDLYTTPTLNYELKPAPINVPTTFCSRIDNKATVVGIFTDYGGKRYIYIYIYALVDAMYRSSNTYSWSNSSGLGMPNNYKTDGTQLESLFSATEITNGYEKYFVFQDMTVFNVAKNAYTVTISNIQFESVLPNFQEIANIKNNALSLDSLDPTSETYNQNSLNSNGMWSCTEQSLNNAWWVNSNNETYSGKVNSTKRHVIPIIEIPID